MPAATRESAHRPPYLAAAVAAACVFGLYLITLAPTTAMWDTSEYITAAYTLGVPHPPGNPFFVLLGRFFTLLPIAPNIAMRVNILAALSSAVTAGLWFLVTERVLAAWITNRWQRLCGAAVAALVGGTAFTVWAQSVVNEKVYTVSLVGIALVSWLMLRWADHPGAPRANRLLVLAVFLTGLGYANHMAGFLALPAMGLLILVRQPRVLLRWRLMLACVGALALGLSPFATQPIRAAHFPAINEGEPTGCATKLAVGCTLSAETYQRFKYNFDREQYGKPPVLARQAPFPAQLGMWWTYFKWQWLRDPAGRNNGAQLAFAVVFLALGVTGAWMHARRDRTSFVYFATLMATLSVGLIYYVNFRYGASQSPELGDAVAREVRDRDYFFIWSFSAWGVWVALGLVTAWRAVAQLLTARGDAATSGDTHAPSPLAWAMAAPVLLIAAVPLFGNWSSASRRGDTDTADFARDMLNSVEPYGILVTAGDNDMFPLWYAQEVEGVRRDVLVTNMSLMNTDWFVRQMIRRPVFDYDPDTGPALYRDKRWTKPSGAPLKMTLDEADGIPDQTVVDKPMEFIAGNIRATVTPRVLDRADWLVYKLIQDNPDRPVHFARSTVDLPFELGLGDYVATYGLTRRLARMPIAETDTMRRLPGEGWVDIDATRALWSTYQAPASLIRKNKWVDRTSLSVPIMYVTTGIALRDSMLMRGDTAGARGVLDRTRAVASAVGLGEAFDRAIFANPVADTPRQEGGGRAR